jgi:hypothetical protein
VGPQAGLPPPIDPRSPFSADAALLNGKREQFHRILQNEIVNRERKTGLDELLPSIVHDLDRSRFTITYDA